MEGLITFSQKNDWEKAIIPMKAQTSQILEAILNQANNGSITVLDIKLHCREQQPEPDLAKYTQTNRNGT